MFHLNIWKIFRFHDFMGEFREMAEISAVFSCPKNFKFLEYGRVMYLFKAVDLGISNILFVSRNIKILRFYGHK